MSHLWMVGICAAPEAAGVRQYVQLVGRGLVGVDAAKGTFLWGYNHLANETANIPTNAGLIQLQPLKKLQWLNLKRSGFGPLAFSDDGLRHLGGLTELQVLNLYGNRITDTGLDELKSLTNLRVLDLNLTSVTDEGLAKLSDLTQLERLELTSTVGLGGPQISDRGVRHLTALTQLKHLVLIGARVTDTSLEHFAGMVMLTTLHVVDTQLTEDGIRSLQRALPNCEIIQ